MSTTALWISEIFAEMIAEIFAEITCRRAVACLDRVDRLGQIVHASPAGDGVALYRARCRLKVRRVSGLELPRYGRVGMAGGTARRGDRGAWHETAMASRRLTTPTPTTTTTTASTCHLHRALRACGPVERIEAAVVERIGIVALLQ